MLVRKWPMLTPIQLKHYQTICATQSVKVEHSTVLMPPPKPSEHLHTIIKHIWVDLSMYTQKTHNDWM